MKNIFSHIHRSSKIALTAGWIAVFVLLSVSAVLYVGAGRLFDYHSAVFVSEKLLETVRPVCILASIFPLAIEYFAVRKDNA